jgi:O-antigen/teichoic acid export membrane protein
MPSIALPLKYYDDAGRVKPPKVLWLYVAFIAKSILILVGSLTNRDTSESMLEIFYPQKSDFYFGLLLGCFGLAICLLSGFREKIWQTKKIALFSAIKPLIICSLLLDLGFQFKLAYAHYWAFSWNIGVNVLLIGCFIYWLIKSYHLKVMINDWQLIKD